MVQENFVSGRELERLCRINRSYLWLLGDMGLLLPTHKLGNVSLYSPVDVVRSFEKTGSPYLIRKAQILKNQLAL
jgi:hypothetical protein